MICSNLQIYKVNDSKSHGLCSDHLSDTLDLMIACKNCKSKVPVLFHKPIYCESCNSNCPETFSKCNHLICEECFIKTGGCFKCKKRSKSQCDYCFEKDEVENIDCLHQICKKCLKKNDTSCPLCFGNIDNWDINAVDDPKSLKRSETNNFEQKIEKFDIGDDFISQEIEILDSQDKEDNNVEVPERKIMHNKNNTDDIETELTFYRKREKEIEEDTEINRKSEEKNKNCYSKTEERQAREEAKEEISEDNSDSSFVIVENKTTIAFEMPPQQQSENFDFKYICQCFRIV